jgi:DNA polymerase III alpha subunit (gram-positive type)
MNDGTGTCPNCKQGDLITITMAVSGRDLTFSTCHLCESKWWLRDGKHVPLTSVIDMVVKK